MANKGAFKTLNCFYKTELSSDVTVFSNTKRTRRMDQT